jgi:hypothetical protein
MNVVDAVPDILKKSKGRPKGSGKLTMAKYADAKPLAMLPKTENQRVKELKGTVDKQCWSQCCPKDCSDCP